MTAGFSAQVIRGGESTITEIVTEEREETLHLEFKTLSSDATLNRDDRKMIAKAVCGFANAEGGLLILGIETKRTDGVDAAFKKRPIKNISRIRRLLAAALPEMLSPQHSGLSLKIVADSVDENQGFLLVEVAPSDDRPHMSVAERRYFRRGSDGTRVLDHAEIRELMFATREAALKIEWDIRFGPSSAQMFSIWVVLTLRNVGRIPVPAPYVRLNPGQQWAPTSSVNPRHSADGTYGIYGSRDVLIHLNDQIAMAELETGLDLRGTGQHDVKSAVATAKTMEHTYSMASWHAMLAEKSRPVANHSPVEAKGFFGAENASVKEFHFKIEKADLLQAFCRAKSLA